VVGGSVARVLQTVFLGPWMSMSSSKRMGLLAVKPNKKDLESVKGLFEAGKIVPVIDRVYSLDRVAEALRYFGEGRVRGKVVIAMQDNGQS
jgi:NADPH:quinone reductase-like Zn-dependent oxidoreductase